MNQDDSEICILPPYNNLHAQVIARGEEPRIITSGATVSYSVPGNTFSAGKTNFWNYVKPLFGVNLAPNIGLTGNGLSGTMTVTASNDWVATGIPLTPIHGRRDAELLCTLPDRRHQRDHPDGDHAGGGSRLVGDQLQPLPRSRRVSPRSPPTSWKPTTGCTGPPFRIKNPSCARAVMPIRPWEPPGRLGVPTMSASMHTAHATRFTPAGAPGGRRDQLLRLPSGHQDAMPARHSSTPRASTAAIAMAP